MNMKLTNKYFIIINRVIIDYETAKKISTFFHHASNTRSKVDLVRSFFKNAEVYQKKYLIEKAKTTDLTLDQLIEDASNKYEPNIMEIYESNNLSTHHESKQIPLTINGFLSVYSLSEDADVKALKNTFNIDVTNTMQKMMNL